MNIFVHNYDTHRSHKYTYTIVLSKKCKVLDISPHIFEITHSSSAYSNTNFDMPYKTIQCIISINAPMHIIKGNQYII